MARQEVVVRLTPAQALRMERMGEALWPGEKLSASEVTRRLALAQLLWARASATWLRRYATRKGVQQIPSMLQPHRIVSDASWRLEPRNFGGGLRLLKTTINEWL